MVTTVRLSDDELADIKALTKQSDPAEAVRVAMQDYLRYARRMQVKSMSGRVEMIDNWQQLEQTELKSQHESTGSGAD
jgi:metal-responsive CopG/Arc/MetJ family transcriptional regulator